MELRELTPVELVAFEVSKEIEELSLLEAERIKGILLGYKMAKKEIHIGKEDSLCN